MRFSLFLLAGAACTATQAAARKFSGIESLAFDPNHVPSTTLEDPLSKRSSLVKRAAPIGTALGCYVDAPSGNATVASGRVLNATYTTSSSMSMTYCTNHCTGLGYKYAGVEYTQECWCGNSIRTGTYTGPNQDTYMTSPVNYGVQVASSQCNVTCPGNSSQTCGQHWRLNIYLLPDCLTGYTAYKGNNNQTLCCASGYTGYKTVCCASGKVEIGTTGVCCTSGSTVTNGACVAPTGQTSRKRSPGAGRTLVLKAPKVSNSNTYGLEANKDGALCPEDFAACPVSKSLTSEAGMTKTLAYECVDTKTELESCGGCTTMGSGVDCTKISGAKLMGCNSGRCEVYSCQKGWKIGKDGSSCIRRG